MKRGAMKPLILQEVEPGQAIQWVLSIPHPFTEITELPIALAAAVRAVTEAPQQTLADRVRLLTYWEEQAHRLLPLSDQRLRALDDAHLRRLLRGAADHEPAVLGQICHVELYRAMLQACDSLDQDLPNLLLHGFPIVGPIAASGRWPPYEKEQKTYPVQYALDRAWAIRQKIIRRVHAVPVTENLQKIWDSTLEDVQEGSSVGPFSTEEEVTQFLSSNDLIPTQRFKVVQRTRFEDATVRQRIS